MTFFKSLFMASEPEEEQRELEAGENYRLAMDQIASQITPQQQLRAIQLSQMRPDASPGVLITALQEEMDDDTFNYLANQDVGDDGWSIGDAVGWAADKFERFSTNAAMEYVAKPVIRTVFAGTEMLAEEGVQRPFVSAMSALGSTDQEFEGGFRERYLQAYRQYGDSAGRRALESATGLDPMARPEDDPDTPEDESSFLGTGFLPGGAVGADPQTQRTLTINGQRATVGRLLADGTVGNFGADPGEAAYDWTAGILQFAVDVGTDPSVLISGGTTGLARKGAALTARGLAAKGGANVTEEALQSSAVRRFLKPDLSEEGMRRVNNNKILQWLDERDGLLTRRNRFTRREQGEALRLSQQAMDELAEGADEVSARLAGEMMGFFESRTGRSIDISRVGATFRQSEELLDQLAEAEIVDIMLAFGRSKADRLDPKAMLALDAAKTREEVLTVLLDQIGKGNIRERKIYSGLGRAARQTAEKSAIWQRFYGTGFAGMLDFNNVTESAAKVDTLTRQARMSREDRANIMRQVLSVDEGDAAGMASVATGVLQKVTKHIADETGVEVRDGFLKNLTDSWEQLYDQLDNYNINNVSEGIGDAPANRSIRVMSPDGSDWEEMTISGAHLASELQKFRIYMPRSEEIRRAMVRDDKLRRLYQSEYWDKSIRTARFITTGMFKPLALLRPAYIIRTQADDQARMASAGYASVWKNPMEFLQLVRMNQTKGDEALMDLIGGRLVDARQARNIISGMIVDSSREGVPEVMNRVFRSVRKPADPTKVTDEMVDGWRTMMGRLRNDPIANMMAMTGMSPKQMFLHIRGKQGMPDDAVRFMERDMVSEALARKFDSDDLFTLLDEEGGETAGRLRRLLEDETNPFDGEDIAPVVDDLLNEVAEDLGMSRDHIESLFDEFEEDIATRLSREWREYMDDEGVGRVAPEFGMLSNLTRSGARWGDVKRTKGVERVREGRGPVLTAEGSGQVLQRGIRMPVSQVAEVMGDGTIKPFKAFKRGQIVDFFTDRRLTRATDEPSVANRFALTEPEDSEAFVEVVYKFDDDTKVTNMSWASGSTSDVMLARDQTFRVKQGAPGRLAKGDDGVYRMEIELQSVPDTSVLGQMAQGRTPDWFFDLYDHHNWDGTVKGLRAFLDDALDERAIRARMARTTEADLARRRIEDPNKITEAELDEWITNQRPDIMAKEQRAEMERFADEVEALQKDGVIDPEGTLAAMAQRAPVIRDQDLYVVMDDIEDVFEGVDGVRAFNESDLRGSKVGSKGNTVRAFETRKDALAEGNTIIRVRAGEAGVQALKVGTGRFVLPETTLRMRRAFNDGGVTRIEAEVVTQPARRVMDPTTGGDSDVIRALRNLARNGDMKAQQVLLNDDALLEYLNTVARRIDHDTGGSDEVRRMMTRSLRDEEGNLIGPDFDDPSQNAKIRDFLREHYEAMPNKVNVERKQRRPYDPKGAFTAWIDGQYESIISKPANVLSRLPTWQQAMVADLERQMFAIKDDALRREVWEMANENLHITPTQKRSLLKAMDDAKGTEGVIESLEEVNDLMLSHATKTVEETLFDVSTRSAFQEAFDAWVPFADAWREGIEIWGRLIKNDPSLVAKGFARYRGGINSGAIRTNENGERVFTVPGSTALANWVEAKAEASARRRPGEDTLEGTVLGALGGAVAGARIGSRFGAGILGGAAGAGIGAAIGEDPNAVFEAGKETFRESFLGEEDDGLDLRFESRLTGANLILQSVGPGFGPLVQWPAGAFLPDDENFSGIRRLFDPFGAGPDDRAGLADPIGFIDSLVPPYMDKVWNAWREGDPDPAQWNSAVNDALDALAMKQVPVRDEDGNFVKGDDGRIQYRHAYDPNDPVDVQRLTDDAEAAARAMLVVRGYVQGISITGVDGQWSINTGQSLDPDYEPGQQWDPETDPDGVFFDLSVLADEYYDLLEQSGYDSGQATREFIDQFGVTPAYLATPRSRAKGPLPRTVKGASWAEDNEQLFTNYPAVAGFFAPLEEGVDGDYSVWRRQVERGDRDLSDPEERIALANQSRARQRYFAVKDRISMFPQDFQRTLLAPIKAELDREFPGWEGAIAGVANMPQADRIEQLVRAANDPSVDGEPLTGPLRKYLAQRDQFLQILRVTSGESGATLARKDAVMWRQMLRAQGERLAQESPEFKAVWGRLLKNEVEEA